MNLTEKIKAAAEADAAKANDENHIAAMIRAAIIENPWSEKHRNLTSQIMIAKVAPDVAAVLKAHPGYTVPQMFDLLPAKAQEVVKGTLASMKADNSTED